jgi:hypothetical protein
MSRFSPTLCAVVCLASLLTYAGPAAAQSRTTSNATFNNPVQLPGLVLPAGQYTFSLAVNRRSVVVSDVNHRVVTTLIVQSITRAKRGDTFTVRSSAAGSPEISEWYAGGGTTGVQFAYSRVAQAPDVPATARK